MIEFNIPKRIFYLWCGCKQPLDVVLCLRSWQQAMPDFEIVEINEKDNTYFDFKKELKENDWFRSVYERKMWGFVADYVRFKAIYDHGGIWLDTDVSSVKSFEPLLSNSCFIGRENNRHVETAVIGAVAGHPLLKSILDFYNEEIWTSELYTSPRVVSYVLEKNYGFVPGQEDIINLQNIVIYPPKYFYPLPLDSSFSQDCLSQESVCIHWWKASWNKAEIKYWLSHKHLWGKKKAMKIKLTPYQRVFLFGLIRIGRYETGSKCFFLFSLPVLKIKITSKKILACLFGFLPIIKLK